MKNKKKIKIKNKTPIKSKTSKRKIKRNVKDSVFTKIFGEIEYAFELYKTLHPEDKDVTIDDVKIVTLTNILSNGLYNDLGLLIKNTLLFFMEDQSTWSINVLPRSLLYVTGTYKNYIDEKKLNVYGTKKVVLPMPELYVIYTGKKKIREGIYSLNEEFFNNEAPIDLKIKVITSAKKGSIVQQYIDFSKQYDEFMKNKNFSEKSVLKFIDKCIKDGILSEFLSKNRREIMITMSLLYNQDVVDKMREYEIEQEAIEKGREEGREEGIEKGKIMNMISLVKKKLIDIDVAIKELGISETKFKKLMRTV